MDFEQAKLIDVQAIIRMDSQISESALERKVRDGEIFLARKEGEIIACLRYSLFWDKIPFINLLSVVADERRNGLGSGLVRFWETRMRELGHDLLMSSAESDEVGRSFFERIGYKRIGSFEFPNQADEILFLKRFDRKQ